MTGLWMLGSSTSAELRWERTKQDTEKLAVLEFVNGVRARLHAITRDLQTFLLTRSTRISFPWLSLKIYFKSFARRHGCSRLWYTADDETKTLMMIMITVIIMRATMMRIKMARDIHLLKIDLKQWKYTSILSIFLLTLVIKFSS